MTDNSVISQARGEEVPETWVARQFRLVEESINQRPDWMKPKACRKAKGN